MSETPLPGAVPDELTQATFFELPAAPPSDAAPPSRDSEQVRLRRACRSQVTWGPLHLDAQLPEDHAARSICAVIDRLDLSALYGQVDALEGVAGAPAIDPKILLGLWVYATSEGEGSAREIWRLTRLHDAYRWICGGVEVGYHTLSDFRSGQGEVIDQLITQVLALLMKQDLVDLSRVAQDGTRVRASAGAASFRREQRLDDLMREAREHLAEVTRAAADPAMTARRAGARKRGARQRLERLDAALAQIPEIIETKKRSGAKDATPRASTTDPDARVMKMGDGGYRPAFNVQFATTTDEARVIVGVEVSNRGSDAGRSTPMLDQIEERTGKLPEEFLVDGGYAQHEAIEQAAEREVTLYAPVPKARQEGVDPHERRRGDSEAVAQWRERMSTDEAKEIYRERAATAETVNADAKAHRGLDGVTVRGLKNVTGSVGLFALTYDILRLITLSG